MLSLLGRLSVTAREKESFCVKHLEKFIAMCKYTKNPLPFLLKPIKNYKHRDGVESTAIHNRFSAKNKPLWIFNEIARVKNVFVSVHGRGGGNCVDREKFEILMNFRNNRMKGFVGGHSKKTSWMQECSKRFDRSWWACVDCIKQSMTAFVDGPLWNQLVLFMNFFKIC